MTKLYPLLLWPLFWACDRSSERQRGQAVLYALVPVLALTGAMVVVGGWPAAVMPYTLQLSREAEPGGLLHLVYVLWPQALPWARGWAQIGQLALPGWWLARHSLGKVRLELFTYFKLAALTLLLLIGLFSFYSNQWWVWVVPFLVVVMPPGKRWLVVAYDLVNYAQAPVALELWGKGSGMFELVVAARSLALASLVIWLWRQLPRGWWRLA